MTRIKRTPTSSTSSSTFSVSAAAVLRRCHAGEIGSKKGPAKAQVHRYRCHSNPQHCFANVDALQAHHVVCSDRGISSLIDDACWSTESQKTTGPSKATLGFSNEASTSTKMTVAQAEISSNDGYVSNVVRAPQTASEEKSVGENSINGNGALANGTDCFKLPSATKFYVYKESLKIKRETLRLGSVQAQLPESPSSNSETFRIGNLGTGPGTGPATSSQAAKTHLAIESSAEGSGDIPGQVASITADCQNMPPPVQRPPLLPAALFARNHPPRGRRRRNRSPEEQVVPQATSKGRCSSSQAEPTIRGRKRVPSELVTHRRRLVLSRFREVPAAFVPSLQRLSGRAMPSHLRSSDSGEAAFAVKSSNPSSPIAEAAEHGDAGAGSPNALPLPRSSETGSVAQYFDSVIETFNRRARQEEDDDVIFIGEYPPAASIAQRAQHRRRQISGNSSERHEDPGSQALSGAEISTFSDVASGYRDPYGQPRAWPVI